MAGLADDQARATIVHVTGAGAIGGFASWLLAAAASTHLLPWPWYGAIPAAMFLGGMAAGLGVFVLANTDVTNLGRTVFFAALCGAFFKPVFDAGETYLTGLVANHQASASADQVATATNQLQNTLHTGDAAQVPDSISTATVATTAMLQQSGGVTDQQVKDDVTHKSTAAVDALVQAAPRQPGEVVDNLEKIGTAAQSNGQSAVASHVLQKLSLLESAAPDAAVQKKIQAARASILAAAKKPE